EHKYQCWSSSRARAGSRPYGLECSASGHPRFGPRTQLDVGRGLDRRRSEQRMGCGVDDERGLVAGHGVSERQGRIVHPLRIISQEHGEPLVFERRNETMTSAIGWCSHTPMGSDIVEPLATIRAPFWISRRPALIHHAPPSRFGVDELRTVGKDM